MYNEKMKTKFIQRYNSASTRKLCESVFDSCEPFEKEKNRDLCTFSKDELQPLIDKIAGIRMRGYLSKIIMLKDYSKWCAYQKYPDACDGMLKIETVGVDKIKNNMVSNPLMLQDYLNIICEPETEQTTDNIYRCYYWLAYSGVSEADSLNIKCSDVDFENMVIHYNGLNIPLYYESLPAFHNCVRLTQFVYKHPNYDSTKIVYMDRAPGDTLIRGIRNAPNIKTMRVELSRRAKAKIDKGKLHQRLSYKHTQLSGIFYRKYQQEIAGYSIDFYDEAIDFTKDKVYKLDSGRNKFESKVRQVAKDYMEDYLRWKIAFNL